MLFTGDASASGPIIENMAVIRDSLAMSFPDTPTYIVLGNHDFPASPVGPEAGDWCKHVLATWGTQWLDQAAQAEFVAHGMVWYGMVWYGHVPQVPGVRLVALNTELFYHGKPFVMDGSTMLAAMAHLAWINATLAVAAKAGERVHVVGHVPIGVETAYGNDRRVPSSLRSVARLLVASLFWAS